MPKMDHLNGRLVFDPVARGDLHGLTVAVPGWGDLTS